MKLAFRTTATLLASIFTISTIASASGSAALMQLAKLTASDATANAQFGKYVAVSGNTAVVSAGELYVFVKDSSGWMDTTETAKLAASSGNVEFSAAAISGNIVAASGNDTVTGNGGVYIFERPASGWSGTVNETAILGSYASSAIAISGSIVVQGGGTLDSIFVRPSTGWQTTTVSTATLSVPEIEGSNFTTLAASGDAVVAGAPGNYGGEGTVYVYVKPSSGWSGQLNPTATLVASNGQLSDGLGWSVAISGNTIVAGASNVKQGAGAAYVFVAPSSGWTSMTETAELTATNTIDLGWSVAVSGNAITASAPFSTVGFNQYQGSAYVYVKPSSGWKSTSNPRFQLSASDGAADDLFGLSIAMSGTTVLAGAPQATVNGNSLEGAAYVFGK